MTDAELAACGHRMAMPLRQAPSLSPLAGKESAAGRKGTPGVGRKYLPFPLEYARVNPYTRVVRKNYSDPRGQGRGAETYA